MIDHFSYSSLNIPCPIQKIGNRLNKRNHCNLFLEAKEWLDGELLGDGCIYSRSPYSANFNYSSKYIEYINYISDTLKSFGIEQTGKIRERNTSFNSHIYLYCSRDYAELLPIRQQWYPKSKKIVPRDIKLTPITCRQWYIGDGCLKHPKKGNIRPYIILYTQSFSVPDVEWLMGELNKLGFKTTIQNNDNTIYISTYSTQKFLNYIGESPMKCYQYKWNYKEDL